MVAYVLGHRSKFKFFDFYTDWSNIVWWASFLVWLFQLFRCQHHWALKMLMAAVYSNIIAVGIAGTFIIHVHGVKVVQDLQGTVPGSPVDEKDIQLLLEYDMIFHVLPLFTTLIFLVPTLRFSLTWQQKVGAFLTLLAFALTWALVPSSQGGMFIEKYDKVYDNPGFWPLVIVALTWILSLAILF